MAPLNSRERSKPASLQRGTGFQPVSFLTSSRQEVGDRQDACPTSTAISPRRGIMVFILQEFVVAPVELVPAETGRSADDGQSREVVGRQNPVPPSSHRRLIHAGAVRS